MNPHILAMRSSAHMQQQPLSLSSAEEVAEKYFPAKATHFHFRSNSWEVRGKAPRKFIRHQLAGEKASCCGCLPGG